MREYIHFFENSDLRDAYENGSDYTEPYVSYTPVINGYEAQFNGEPTPISFLVRKSGDLYQISSNDVNLNSIDGKVPFVSVESNSVYLDTSGLPDDIFVFLEDLNLNEESTEFIFNGNTYYLVYDTLNNNIWHVYRDSEHTEGNGMIVKIDIVSVPSSSSTDFVHYNKKYNVKFIDTYQRKQTSSCAGVTTTEITGKGYNIRDLILVGGIPYSEICDYIQNDTLVIIKFYDTASNGTRYGVYKKSIDTFTNTYPTSTDNTQSYRTVIPSDDYIEFEPDWTFRYNSIYCTFSDYLPTDVDDSTPPIIDGPIIVEPISIDEIS